MARTERSRRRAAILLTGAVILAAAAGLGFAGLQWYRAGLVAEARERGFRDFDEGRYAQALEPLSYYVSRRRDDVEAVLRLAFARESVFAVNNRHLISAAAFYEEALKREPGNRRALEGMLGTYRRLGYQIELRRTADALLATEPNHVGALEARMGLAAALGKWDEAIRDAETLVQVQPNSMNWRSLLLEFLRQAGRPIDQRLALVDTWIAGGEPDGRYRLLRAEQLILASRFQEADSPLSDAARLGLADLPSLERLVELLQILGREEDIIAVLEASQERIDPVKLRLMEARVHFLFGRLDRAQEAFDALQATEPEDVRYRLRMRAVVAELRDDTERADLALAEWLAATPEGTPDRAAVEAWAVAARGARAGSELPVAERRARLEAALQRDPDDSFLLFLLGEIELQVSEVETARALLLSAYRAEGRRWGLAGVRAAHANLRSGRTEESFRITRELMLRQPRNPVVYLGFAEACSALSREGRPPSLLDPTLPRGFSASSMLKQVYEQVERDEAFLPPLVTALVDEGEGDDAVGIVLARLRDRTTTPRVLLDVAEILLPYADPSDLEAILDTACVEASLRTSCDAARVRLLLRRQRLDEAGAVASAAVEATAEGSPERIEALRAAAEVAIAEDSPEINAILARYLAAAGADIRAASFVLAQGKAWSDAALVRSAIDALRRGAGPDSQQAVLAEAMRVLAFDRGDPESIAKATVSVNEFLRQNPRSVPALVTLGRLLTASSPPDWERASEFLVRAIDAQPQRLDLYPEAVILLQKSGDSATASRLLQTYLRLSGDTGGRRTAVALMLSQGSFMDAIPALESISGQTQGESDLITLAEANRRAGRVDTAERIYRDAASRPSRTAISVQAYADFLARSGRIRDARQVVEEDAAASPPRLDDTERALFLVRLEMAYGTPEDLERALEIAQRRAGTDPRLAAIVARRAASEGDPGRALAVVQEALQAAPEDPDLLALASGLLLADPATRAKAKDFMRSLAETRPEWAELLYVIDLAAGENGTVNASPEVLRQAIVLTDRYPLFPLGWINAVNLHVAADRKDEAVRLVRRGIARLPTDPAVAELAVRVFMTNDRLEEAREAIELWRRLVPESTLEPDYALAALALSESPSRASEILAPHREVLAIDPERYRNIARLSAVADALCGRIDASRETLVARLDLPEFISALVQIVRHLPAEQAARMLDPVPVDRLEPPARLAIAAETVAMMKRSGPGFDRTARAATVRRILDTLPDPWGGGPEIGALRADLLVAEGRREEAVQAFLACYRALPAADRTAIERGSASSGADERLRGVAEFAAYCLNNAAAAESDRGEVEAALGLLEDALRILPDSGELLDTKARVLLAAGKAEEARNVATEAVKFLPSAVGARVTLGRAELAAGRPEAAERILRECERLVLGDLLLDRARIDDVERLRTELEGLQSKRVER